MMRMIIQEEPPQPLLHPQPISRTPFRFSNSYYEKQKEVLQKQKNRADNIRPYDILYYDSAVYG